MPVRLEDVEPPQFPDFALELGPNGSRRSTVYNGEKFIGTDQEVYAALEKLGAFNVKP